MPLVLVAVPAELILATAILLLLWASVWIFQKPIAHALAQLPVVGGQAAQAAADTAVWISGVAGQWAKFAIDPVVQLWNVAVNAIGGFVGSVTSTVEQVWEHLAATGLLLWTAVTHLSDIAAGLQAQVRTVAATAGASARTLLDLAGDVATILAVRIPAAIAAAVHTAEAWAAAQLASAVASLQAADHAIRLALAQAIDSTTVRLGQAIDGVKAWAGGYVGALVGPLVRGIEALGARLDGLAGQLSGDISKLWTVLAPLLALDLARVVPRVIDQVETMERECVAPTCAAIRPRLDLLNLLSDGVMLGLMLELVHEAIHDPQAAAHTAANGAGELRSLTDELVGPILGVRV